MQDSRIKQKLYSQRERAVATFGSLKVVNRYKPDLTVLTETPSTKAKSIGCLQLNKKGLRKSHSEQTKPKSYACKTLEITAAHLNSKTFDKLSKIIKGLAKLLPIVIAGSCLQ